MLTIDRVTKRFGARVALDEVSFGIHPGRLTGFVGANGAGKTTAMRIMLGLLLPDAGAVRLNDAPVDRAERRRFGYMPEERGLYPKMRLGAQLTHLARLHGLAKPDAQRNAERLARRLGLDERLGDPIEKLSLGNQQRAQIAAALVHDPTVLVLDEPFSGLDPFAVDTVVEVLGDYAAAGVPVLFSSHQLDVVERLCDDLVIIADGTIRAAGDRRALAEQHQGLRFALAGPDEWGWLEAVAGIEPVEREPRRVVFEAQSHERAQEALRQALALGDVTEFQHLRPSLAAIFREVIA